MNTGKHRAVAEMTRALFDSDLIAARLLLALAEMFWAIGLLWPGDTFGRPTYTMMSQIAPENCWAVVFLVTSVVQYRIISPGWHGTKGAWVFSCFNAGLWVLVNFCMFASVYPPPAAISGELALAVGALWVAARPVVNKILEHKHAAKLAAR